MCKQVFVIAVSLMSIGLCPVLAGELQNGGFEESSPATGLPGTTGVWVGDLASFVTAENGITPPEGQRMLRLLRCGRLDRATTLNSSELFQTVDLSDEVDLIANGSAVVSARMLCNRVAGDAETDDAFAIVVYAFAGAPSTFPNVWPTYVLEQSVHTVFSDADPATWELAATCFILPPETGFVAVRVNASENIFNDSSGSDPELDGHYADQVQFEIRCLGDITNDRVIDAADGIAFTEAVAGPDVAVSLAEQPSDLDCDGDVDVVDLAEMQIRPAEGC